MNIKKERFLDWVEAIGYAFNDIDLNYHDEEAEEQVRGAYSDMIKLCKEQGINLKAEMKKRGAAAAIVP